MGTCLSSWLQIPDIKYPDLSNTGSGPISPLKTSFFPSSAVRPGRKFQCIHLTSRVWCVCVKGMCVLCVWWVCVYIQCVLRSMCGVCEVWGMYVRCVGVFEHEVCVSGRCVTGVCDVRCACKGSVRCVCRRCVHEVCMCTWRRWWGRGGTVLPCRVYIIFKTLCMGDAKHKTTIIIWG